MRTSRREQESGQPAARSERAPVTPATPERILQLQQSAGNAAVARLLMPAAEQVEIPGIRLCKGGTVEPLLDMEHHWIEIGDESYGWWPSRDPSEGNNSDRILGWTGVPGILNGTTLGIGGTATRDPRHGAAARRLAVVGPASVYGGDGAAASRRAADAIRDFARGYTANYSWNPLGTDCQEFAEYMLRAADLRERLVIDPLVRAPDLTA